MKRIFVDGSSGTTGLRIRERLSLMQDVHVTELTEAMRKDPAERRKALNSADIAVLCLPDEAAREAVEMTDNPDTVVIDASSAHRTAPGWVYVFPEAFPGREEEIAQSRRISVPGCHASGFTALVAPLVRAGVLLSTAVLPVYSLTGYSGCGNKMIM